MRNATSPWPQAVPLSPFTYLLKRFPGRFSRVMAGLAASWTRCVHVHRGALRALLRMHIGRFFRFLALQPPKQEPVFDLKGRWSLELFSEPCDRHHWITAAASTSSPRTTGTMIGGTSQGITRSRATIGRFFQKQGPAACRARIRPEGQVTSVGPASHCLTCHRPGSAAGRAWSRSARGSWGLHWNLAVGWS